MRQWYVLVVLALLGVGIAGANTPPLAEAGLDQQVDRNTTVYLDAGGSVDPDGNVTGYEWSIIAPDGTGLRPDCQTCERTRFVPNQTGQYNVTVTVTDDDGVTREDTLYVLVEQATPPSVEVTGPEDVIAGDRRTYRAEATAGDAELSTVTWRVDGSHHSRVAVNGSSGTVTEEFSFAGGNHSVTAVAIDDAGKRDTDRQVVGAVDSIDVNVSDGGGGGTIDPGTIDGSGECGPCTSNGLITLRVEEENGKKTADWEVSQDLASRMKGDDTTVEVAGAEVHVRDLTSIEEKNEGKRVVELFEEKDVTEREMVKGAAAGISEKNNFQATGEGSLGSISNERNSIEYDGWLPSRETENDPPDTSTGDSGTTTYDGSTTADRLFSSGGANTDDSDGWDSSDDRDSGDGDDDGGSPASTGDSGGGSSNDSGSSSDSDSGGYHGVSGYTGGGGYVL